MIIAAPRPEVVSPEVVTPFRQPKQPQILQHQLVDGRGEVKCTWTITREVAEHLNKKNQAEGDAHQWLPVPVEQPRQLKLLGAVVKGVGVVTSISSTLFDCFCLIQDPAGNEHHRFLKDLTRDELTYLSDVPPYVKHSRRIGIGVWDDCYSLVTVPDVQAALEAAA